MKIKFNILLLIFFTISNGPAQSASFLDKLKDDTKSVTDTVSKSLKEQSENA